ncbi:Fe2OG dioxygenase domain-containing protein [Psidium guajava]|nr:Fe2OG dioxygenase domain-containing protein [Psidium guajava]
MQQKHHPLLIRLCSLSKAHTSLQTTETGGDRSLAGKMRGKAPRQSWSSKSKLGLPAVVVACAFFFLAGFYGSIFLPQDASGLKARARGLESVSDARGYTPLPRGETGDDSFVSIPFQVLSWGPRALYFPNFATAEQCQSIIEMVKAGLKPSALALRKGETEENTKGIRTSSGMFISASEDKTGTLDIIEEKIARVQCFQGNMEREDLKLFEDITMFQAFNVLRYEIGQRYNSHYDAFSPAEYGPQKSQRVASFCCTYRMLKRGRNMFPYENGMNMDGTYDFQKCVGLKVKPRQGDGLLFYSLLPNGTIDPFSLHGSCPVIKGEKWVATKWIRDRVQDD